MSTSFPFLAIAREYGVSYGEVIRVAHVFQGAPAPPWTMIEYGQTVGTPIYFAIAEACEREGVRRAGVIEMERLKKQGADYMARTGEDCRHD